MPFGSRETLVKPRSAEAIRSRLQTGWVTDNFFPQVSDLPENLTVEQNRSEYGGVGSKRYPRTLADIDARLDRCPALSMAAP